MTEEVLTKEEKLSRLKSFLTCPLFSKDKADELREVHSESEKINARMESLVSSVKELAKSQGKANRALVKEFKELSKKTKREFHDRNDEIKDSLDALRSDIDKQTTQVQLSQKTASSQVASAIETITGVNGSIDGIRDFLSKNNEVLRRLQEGYDYQVLKNFIKPILRMINDLDQQKEGLSDSVKKGFIEIGEDLVELLDRNGIEQIELDFDTPYAEQKKYAEASGETEKTDDPERRGLIASVERVGYRYEFNDGQERVIRPALVKLYE